MLIRFVLNNLYSFGEMKEFNMLPSPRYTRLRHHKYNIKGFNVLKLAAIYGANGAGKSNLIKALEKLQDIILRENIPYAFSQDKFKLQGLKNNDIQTLAVEFFQDGEAFCYALEIEDNKIKTEELYSSGLGVKEDQLIYERITDENGKSKIQFLKKFEDDEEGRILKKVIEKNLSKPETPLLKLITTLEAPHLEKVTSAYHWFKDSLKILSPDSKPQAFAHLLDINENLKSYVEDIVCAYNVGIDSIDVETQTLDEFTDGIGQDLDIDKIILELERSKDNIVGLGTRRGNEIIVIKKDQTILVKQIKLKHKNINGILTDFDLDEESDGTIRLLDFVPALWGMVSASQVYIIDEIERSLHPLIIKELIKKFSNDTETKGQLIFTTHESQLLDQHIFRQDEIWFAEKNKAGSTDMYSLSDFKEHHTTDIRKGYLNGRYGSIPFLGNLKDLNWHQYDIKKQTV